MCKTISRQFQFKIKLATSTFFMKKIQSPIPSLSLEKRSLIRFSTQLLHVERYCALRTRSLDGGGNLLSLPFFSKWDSAQEANFLRWKQACSHSIFMVIAFFQREVQWNIVILEWKGGDYSMYEDDKQTVLCKEYRNTITAKCTWTFIILHLETLLRWCPTFYVFEKRS